jgi:hypothetical protein
VYVFWFLAKPYPNYLTFYPQSANLSASRISC